MSEIADVVQIVRIEFEGLQLAMKLGSASIKTMQKAAKFLMGMLAFEKNKGKTGLKKILMRGGDLQVFQFEEKDIKKVQKLCRKYGVLYSLVPKLDKNSTTRELLFHSEATPRVNMLVDKMKGSGIARIKSMDSFINETDEKKLNAFDEYLKKEGEKKGPLEKGEAERLAELRKRMRRIEVENDTSLADITIAKKMIEAETKDQIIVRIPGTWEEEARYIHIDKKDAMNIYEGKTVLSFIDRKKEYTLYDKGGKKIESVAGDKLYAAHFSKVEPSVRKKAEEILNRTKVETRVR